MGSPGSSEALLYMESDCAFPPVGPGLALPLLAPMGLLCALDLQCLKMDLASF